MTTQSTRTTGRRTRGASISTKKDATETSPTTLTIIGTVKEFCITNSLIPDKFIRESKSDAKNPTLRVSPKADVKIQGEEFVKGQIYGIVLSQNAAAYVADLNDGNAIGCAMEMEDFEFLRVAHRIDPVTGQDMGLIVVTNAGSGFEGMEGF
jgi:hypothetical protein